MNVEDEMDFVDYDTSDVKTFYLCTDCNYRTERKHHFNRHLETIKHVTIVRLNQTNQNKYVCNCGKTYIYQSGLCKHKKICEYGEIDDTDDYFDSNYDYEVIDGDGDDINEYKNGEGKNSMILKLIRQNEEFKQMLVDQNKKINERHKNDRYTNLIKYTRHKLYIHKSINKKYNIIVDYDIDYLVNMGITCFYCDTICKFGNEKESNHPDTLSFDKKNPDIGYCKDNIVVSCWFCNRMKNQTKFEDWKNFINFIKNDNVLELDLSDKEFAKNSSEINLTNIYFHIKQKSPSYYPDLNTAKETFKDCCKKQNYFDPFFNYYLSFWLSLFYLSILISFLFYYFNFMIHHLKIDSYE